MKILCITGTFIGVKLGTKPRGKSAVGPKTPVYFSRSSDISSHPFQTHWYPNVNLLLPPIGTMLILSWNVAAWEPAVAQLKPSQVNTFFSRHGADIVCLQEVKVSQAKLESEPDKVAANVPGWDSFWATNQHKDSRGFQGVATYARKGLTLRASRSPFSSAALNLLGRCLRTEHADFVLFNIYAPAGCNPGGLPMRMQFYTELRAAMVAAMRDTGKPVVLCGDLNVALNPRDVYYKIRRVNVDLLLQAKRRCKCGYLAEDNPNVADANDCCEFKAKLRAAWPIVVDAVERRTVHEQVTYSAYKVARKKFHVRVPVRRAGSEEFMRVGELYESREHAYGSYDFSAIYMNVTGEDLEEEPKLCQPANSMSVRKLKDLLEVVANLKMTERDAYELAASCGESRNALPLLELMREIVKEIDLVDAHLELYPNMDFRYTCWSQYTNQRYTNAGGRIDYFLIHRSLLPALDTSERARSIRCGCTKHRDNPFTEQAGICAATAGGRFKQASYSGGGIEEACPAANEDQFRGTPHTGFIYTPPKLR